MEPGTVLLERGEKLLNPAVRGGCAPTILSCAGPAAELFPVVTHCQDAPAIRCCKGTQRFYRLTYGTPGNGIAHGFAGSENLQDWTLVLRSIVAIEVPILQPYILKMHIIQDGPLDICLADQARQS